MQRNSADKIVSIGKGSRLRRRAGFVTVREVKTVTPETDGGSYSSGSWVVELIEVGSRRARG